ncbi:MAG: zf-HC2 domain-containing protein [Chitinispirillia bacterium]|nr:zf-HC2 domain-containing protein [Chitinispirillia bacterium]MCL2268454.1 zf-HC2 domain-containing protein [Chitinispirillia bacterium]
MACSKFEVAGLLYLSGELNASEAEAYKTHLNGCEECRRETEEYEKERASLYTSEVLGDYPSEAVDNEILRVCANPKKMVAASAITPMMLIRRYAPVPILLMLIMVAVGGYVKYHSMSAGDLRAKLIAEDSAPPAVATPETLPSQNSAETGTDENLALDDSSGDSGRVPVKPLGNLEMEGVVTVSEESKP